MKSPSRGRTVQEVYKCDRQAWHYWTKACTLRRKKPTEVIVLQQVEVAHLLSHGDLLHSALVQVELLSNVNIAVQNTPRSQFYTYLVFTALLFKWIFFFFASSGKDEMCCYNISALQFLFNVFQLLFCSEVLFSSPVLSHLTFVTVYLPYPEWRKGLCARGELSKEFFQLKKENTLGSTIFMNNEHYRQKYTRRSIDIGVFGQEKCQQ